jgi:hypothetical protein
LENNGKTVLFLPLRGQLLVLAGRPQELILTTDANDFVVKTNNSEALRITLRNTGLGVTAFGLLAH